MHDYLMSSCCMAIRRGRVSAATGFMAFHLAPWILGRGVNGCMWACQSYRMGINVNQNGTGAITTAWSQVRVATAVPYGPLLTNVLGTGCPISGVAISTTDGGSGGWSNYTAAEINADSGHTYPAIFQVSGVVGQIAGVTGGSTVVAYMATVESAAAITEAQWAPGAHWRLRIPA